MGRRRHRPRKLLAPLSKPGTKLTEPPARLLGLATKLAEPAARQLGPAARMEQLGTKLPELGTWLEQLRGRAKRLVRVREGLARPRVRKHRQIQ